MKKQIQINQSSQTLRAIISLPKSQLLLTGGTEKQKVIQQPDDATIKRLNALAKQSPFCYCYREKENDSL